MSKENILKRRGSTKAKNETQQSAVPNDSPGLETFERHSEASIFPRSQIEDLKVTGRKNEPRERERKHFGVYLTSNLSHGIIVKPPPSFVRILVARSHIEGIVWRAFLLFTR